MRLCPLMPLCPYVLCKAIRVWMLAVFVYFEPWRDYVGRLVVVVVLWRKGVRCCASRFKLRWAVRLTVWQWHSLAFIGIVVPVSCGLEVGWDGWWVESLSQRRGLDVGQLGRTTRRGGYCCSGTWILTVTVTGLEEAINRR